MAGLSPEQYLSGFTEKTRMLIPAPPELHRLIFSYILTKDHSCMAPFIYNDLNFYGYCRTECYIWLQKMLEPPKTLQIKLLELDFPLELKLSIDKNDPMKNLSFSFEWGNSYNRSHMKDENTMFVEDISTGQNPEYKEYLSIKEWLQSICKELEPHSKTSIKYTIPYNIYQLSEEQKESFTQFLQERRYDYIDWEEGEGLTDIGRGDFSIISKSPLGTIFSNKNTTIRFEWDDITHPENTKVSIFYGDEWHSD